MELIAHPKRFFAARRWVGFFCVGGLLSIFLGAKNILDGGWTAWLGGATLAMSLFYFWLAWWLVRRPLIEIRGGVVRQRAVGSSQEASTPLEEMGALKWSTRSTLCFEHRTKGFLVVTVMLLARSKRDALLELLAAGSREAAL